MIQKILTGYGKLFFSLVKIIALVVLCAFFALVLVLPLWKFATEVPQVYSIVVVSLLVCGLVFFLVKNLRNFLLAGFPSPEEKKKRINHLLKNLGKCLIIVTALLGVVFFIMNELAIMALAVLLIAVILYGVLAFGTKKEKH